LKAVSSGVSVMSLPGRKKGGQRSGREQWIERMKSLGATGT